MLVLNGSSANCANERASPFYDEIGSVGKRRGGGGRRAVLSNANVRFLRSLGLAVRNASPPRRFHIERKGYGRHPEYRR